jgi:hypothetical protein
MKLRFAIVLAFAVSLAPAVAHAQMPSAPSLVVDTRLGAGVGVAGGTNVIIIPSLAVGVRFLDRLQLSLGIGLFRTSNETVVNNVVVNTSNTSFTVIPSATIDIIKSRDNRVAWYGKLALPIGAQIIGNGNTDNNLFAIGYDLALGARYSPHPNFAFGVEGGLSGLFIDPTGNNGSGTTSFYGAIVGTFYFAKERAAYAQPAPPPPPQP